MSEMSYTDHIEKLRAADPTLAEQVAEFTSIKHVIDWMEQTGLPLASFDLVAQDEFCHDGLVPLADGRWLSFAMT
jgi:hypothetical protein